MIYPPWAQPFRVVLAITAELGVLAVVFAVLVCTPHLLFKAMRICIIAAVAITLCDACTYSVTHHDCGCGCGDDDIDDGDGEDDDREEDVNAYEEAAAATEAR